MITEELLTREIGVRDGILPTGTKVRLKNNLQGFTLSLENGPVPQKYQGTWTSRLAAEKMLQQYVSDFWDLSEKTDAKYEKKREYKREWDAARRS